MIGRLGGGRWTSVLKQDYWYWETGCGDSWCDYIGGWRVSNILVLLKGEGLR
jgi:hypothetical protein